MDQLYCKLFINTKIKYDGIFNKLLDFLNGVSTHVTIINCDWCEVCLKHNDYYSEMEYINNENDFVFWPYYLEIYNNFDSEAYVNNIKKLITYINSFSDGVIASCDFENLLYDKFKI